MEQPYRADGGGPVTRGHDSESALGSSRMTSVLSQGIGSVTVNETKAPGTAFLFEHWVRWSPLSHSNPLSHDICFR